MYRFDRSAWKSVIPSIVLLGSSLSLCKTEALAKGRGGPGVREETRVYKKTPQGELELAIDFPGDWKARDRRPAVVLYHGGGWDIGGTGAFARQGRYLATLGLVVVRPTYRIKSKHNSTPLDSLLDAKTAMRWVRSRASELGIDPDRIAAGGGSAGGHVAASLFTDEAHQDPGDDLAISTKPNLLILFNPALNLTLSEPVTEWLGGEEKTRSISPNFHLTAGMPPTILLVGTEDRLCYRPGLEWVGQGKKLGYTSEVWVAQNIGHGFFNDSPWYEVTLSIVHEFLARQGYLEGPPTVQLPHNAPSMVLFEQSP